MIKKLISIVSLVSALGFAVALANTNSNESSNTSSSDMNSSGSMSGDSSSGGMSGTAGSDAMEKSSESAKTTVKKHDKWTSAKSCTDENGVTHYKGRSGFQSCVDQMRKKDQMGGTSPQDSGASVMEKSEHSETIDRSQPSSSSDNSNS